MDEKPRAVQLFATCIVEAVRPSVGLAVVDVLERLGVPVEYPDDQTCCGQPAFNAGAWEDARAMARHTVDVLGRSPLPVVVPSGSCADMLIHHYAEILARDPVYGPKVAALAARTYEFSQYLTDVLHVTDPGAAGAGRLTYHPSCHLLRGLGITAGPPALLARVSGAEVAALPGAEECCGFGGLFAVKMSDISGAMLKRKLDAIESTGARAVVSCDQSCLIHIEGGLRRRGSRVQALHLAEVLAGRE